MTGIGQYFLGKTKSKVKSEMSTSLKNLCFLKDTSKKSKH